MTHNAKIYTNYWTLSGWKNDSRSRIGNKEYRSQSYKTETIKQKSIMEMRKMIIEIPKISDYVEINNLAKQVHELHVNWRPDLYVIVEEVIKKEDLKEKIQSKEIFVARVQDNIVGYVTFNIKEKNNPSIRYRKQLNIEAICVDGNNRGKGIGTELLKHLKNIAKDNNCTNMYLTVNEENINAIKIYEKFGFKVKSIAYSMQI